jgi:hypothetical protein
MSRMRSCRFAAPGSWNLEHGDSRLTAFSCAQLRDGIVRCERLRHRDGETDDVAVEAQRCIEIRDDVREVTDADDLAGGGRLRLLRHNRR